MSVQKNNLFQSDFPNFQRISEKTNLTKDPFRSKLKEI